LPRANCELSTALSVRIIARRRPLSCCMRSRLRSESVGAKRSPCWGPLDYCRWPAALYPRKRLARQRISRRGISSRVTNSRSVRKKSPTSAWRRSTCLTRRLRSPPASSSCAAAVAVAAAAAVVAVAAGAAAAGAAAAAAGAAAAAAASGLASAVAAVAAAAVAAVACRGALARFARLKDDRQSLRSRAAKTAKRLFLCRHCDRPACRSSAKSLG
jgi:hypothetical protein